ncbi:hypothetical protein HX99_05455 [Peptococcaceae bacterium SCADC1_2_3]|nr:hypothetical protein DK28_0214970 [Peptococcaceae bacterium SCADC1_2_3]KFI36974.1 hypothetical protein HX99_05455 [Peptococcaceae bacterium SCADC1_2_3]KFI37880.1 hypothetical protein HY02_02130 [Peptococcaceae bacterium SCADC1_2_3]
MNTFYGFRHNLKNIKQEPPYKLFSVKDHELRPVVLLVILPLECYRFFVKIDDSRIADGYPMCIAVQVAYHMPG